ncbi:MAG: vWA domain-containing protein [Bradymonadia bacterium]
MPSSSLLTRPLCWLLSASVCIACGDGKHIDGLQDPGPGEMSTSDGDLVFSEPDDLVSDTVSGGALSVDDVWSEGLPLAIDGLQWREPDVLSCLISIVDPDISNPSSTLEKADYAFAENEVELGREAIFEIGALEALDVVLVLDLSRSMVAGEVVRALKSGALGFVEALPEASQVSVVQFASEHALAQDFSADREVLEDAIDALKTPEGRSGQFTNLWGAVLRAGRALSARDANAGKAVVVFTDGLDNVAEISEEAAVSMLRDNGIMTYVVSVGEQPAPQALSDLAGSRRNFVAEDASKLPERFTQVAHLLSHVVKLTYETPKKSGAHTLHVDIDTGRDSGGFALKFER